MPDDPYLARELSQYFPREVQDKFPTAVEFHRLRREIIATSLVNAVINRGGPACVVRLIDETDADISTIVMAYVAVDESYGLKWLNDAIDALDACIDGQLQLSLYAAVQDLLLSRMVWYVRNVDFKDELEAVVARFGPAIRQIVAGLDTTLPPDLQAATRAACRQTIISNVWRSTAPLTRSRRPKGDWPRICWQQASRARRPSRPGSQRIPKRRGSAARSRRLLPAA